MQQVESSSFGELLCGEARDQEDFIRFLRF